MRQCLEHAFGDLVGRHPGGLDLDAVGGSGPATYVEGFESGLGTFSPMNLDAGIPGNSDEEGLANGDHPALSIHGFDLVLLLGLENGAEQPTEKAKNPSGTSSPARGTIGRMDAESLDPESLGPLLEDYRPRLRRTNTKTSAPG